MSCGADFCSSAAVFRSSCTVPCYSLVADKACIVLPDDHKKTAELHLLQTFCILQAQDTACVSPLCSAPTRPDLKASGLDQIRASSSIIAEYWLQSGLLKELVRHHPAQAFPIELTEHVSKSGMVVACSLQVDRVVGVC